MLLFDGIFGVLALGLWMYGIIDVLTTRGDQVRILPKLAWLAVVVLLVVFGAVAWLMFGRPWAREPALVGATRPRMATSPDDDDEFLAALDARVREQRRKQNPESGDPSGA